MKKKLFSVILIVLIISLLSISAFAKEAEDIGIQPGEQMPDFTVSLTDGSTVTLSEVLKEKDLVIVNFFASWCAPCAKEFPELEDVYQENKDRMEIIAVSGASDDTMEIIADYKEKHGLSFSVGLTGDAFDYLQIPGYPTSIFIDKNGMVGFIRIGAISRKQLRDKVDTYLDADYNGIPLGASRVSGVHPILLVEWVSIFLSHLLMVIGRWGILRKAGRKGWYSLIPFFNIYQEFDACWKGWIGIIAYILGLAGGIILYSFIDYMTIGFILFGSYLLLSVAEGLMLAKTFGLDKITGVSMGLPACRLIVRIIVGWSRIADRLSDGKKGEEQTGETGKEQTGV